MSAHPTNIPELDRKGLREFGLMMAAVIGVLFGLFFPWLLDHGWPRWPWLISAAFALPALVVPMALRPVYRGWMRFGLFMSRVMTPLILGIVFFLVFTPVALGLKLLGKDAMRRKLDPQADSYRIDNRGATMGDMERPFQMLELRRDFQAFMRVRKKFWLAPIIIVMLPLGDLQVASQGSEVAPFIDALF